MMKIPLTQGYFAIVDDDMFPVLTKFKWYAAVFNHTIYARKYCQKGELGSYMHHWVAGYPLPGFVTDHTEGNGLDNRLSKIRTVTQQQNVTNNKTKTSSVFPGVSWDSHHKLWSTAITVKGKQFKIGSYKSEFLAFCMYREATILSGSTLLPEHEAKYKILKALNC